MRAAIARHVDEYAARIDRATPTERDRYVDLLRAVAIVTVVVGHWAATAVFTRDDGRLDGLSVLQVADWTHWLSWLGQVMPIFFLVGGYANATSWQRHAAAGGRWPAWVHRRSVRLLRPTAVFVSLSVGAFVVARLAGVDPALVDRASWVAGIALWFLAVYVAVAALTPLTYALHDRVGARATLVLAGAVVAGDVARVITGEPAWARANFLLGWMLVHQTGYWWRDGALPPGQVKPLLLSVGGAVAAVALVVGGPWPVPMVDVPGLAIQNSSPPSLALLALFGAHLGVVLAIADRVRAWLERPLAWAAVAAVNRVVLTLFLWHMVPVVVGAVALYGTGWLPEPRPASAAWLAWRPVWLGFLAAIAAALVALFAPVERRAGRPVPVLGERPRLAATLAVLGVPLACAGLAQLTLGGLSGEGPLGLPVRGAGAFAAGTLMTTVAGRFVTQPSGRGPRLSG